MLNFHITLKFIRVTDPKVSDGVIRSIAKHYGITPEEAKDEITSEGAESLLDYLVEPMRSATHVIMQRHGLA